jgi:hypothetical protein
MEPVGILVTQETKILKAISKYGRSLINDGERADCILLSSIFRGVAGEQSEKILRNMDTLIVFSNTDCSVSQSDQIPTAPELILKRTNHSDQNRLTFS